MYLSPMASSPALRRNFSLSSRDLKHTADPVLRVCFWHSCPVHAHLPKSNRDWWQRKLEGVVRRDRDADDELTEAGWLVVRVWEHEDPKDAADRIAHLVKERRSRAVAAKTATPPSTRSDATKPAALRSPSATPVTC